VFLRNEIDLLVQDLGKRYAFGVLDIGFTLRTIYYGESRRELFHPSDECVFAKVVPNGPTYKLFNLEVRTWNLFLLFDKVGEGFSAVD